jgi:hypothetical protein
MEILHKSLGVSPGTRSEVHIGRATPRVPKLGVHLSNWIAGLIILIFACEGAFNWFKIFPNQWLSLCFGVATGAIYGTIIASLFVWLPVALGRRFRIKNPGHIAMWTGNIAFGITCVVGLTALAMAIVYYLADGGFTKQVGLTSLSIVFWPAIGRGIKYVLGS